MVPDKQSVPAAGGRGAHADQKRGGFEQFEGNADLFEDNRLMMLAQQIRFNIKWVQDGA